MNYTHCDSKRDDFSELTVEILTFVCFSHVQSLILSTAVPTIIGFSLWREVSFFKAVYLQELFLSGISAALLCFTVLPSGLSRVVGSAGVLRPGYSGADHLDQVGHLIFLYF